MAIEQIRKITDEDDRFDNGYVIIGHSQGGAIARAVIEEMDDHRAHTLISLAGAQNGIFYGPQPTDAIPTQVFMKSLGPKIIPKGLMDFNYTNEQLAAGKLAIDFINLMNSQPALQDKLSMVNLPRSPIRQDWIKVNKFLPVINNIAPLTSGQAWKDNERRKRNFLRLKAAHFFASSADEVIAPWQASILGQYNDVKDITTLSKEFAKLKMLSMKETIEYRYDTYGLRSLDRRGGLFLHAVDGVSHSCWVSDSTPLGSTKKCLFDPVFEQHLRPILAAKEEDPTVQDVYGDRKNPAVQDQLLPVKDVIRPNPAAQDSFTGIADGIRPNTVAQDLPKPATDAIHPISTAQDPSKPTKDAIRPDPTKPATDAISPNPATPEQGSEAERGRATLCQ